MNKIIIDKNMKNINIKKAFSLLEVIFVLVILGIVSSISSQIIVQVYENYITQKAVYNVSTKTELVANQIVNRLTYRIQGTTISKDHTKFFPIQTAEPTEGRDWKKLNDVIIGGEQYTTIEWIGYDNDSFAAEENPGWSGIANYIDATKTQFITPGSNLELAENIIKNLSKDEAGVSRVDLNADDKPAAVLFEEKNNHYNPLDGTYDPVCMGLIPNAVVSETNTTVISSTDCIFAVKRTGTNVLEFVDEAGAGNSNTEPKMISERYKLAWSAYAIAPEFNQQTGLHDLVLYSNYQPWNGDNYVINGTKNTLITNVSVFKFSENGGTIQFKLCAQENIGQDFNISTCKEKVVIR